MPAREAMSRVVVPLKPFSAKDSTAALMSRSRAVMFVMVGPPSVDSMTQRLQTKQALSACTSRQTRTHEGQAMQRTIYDEDHEAFRDSCAAFLAKHVEPNLEKYLEDKALPREFWLAAGAEGFLGLEIPEEFGGAEAGDFRFNAVWDEELSKLNAALASCVAIHTDIAVPYLVDLVHRRAEGALAARLRVRRDPHRDRDDRARWRFGPRGAEDDSRARR